VRYQVAYAARQAQLEGMTIHRLLVKISNMFFTICIHVVHMYNMSVFRHINLSNMSSYDINVSSCLQVCRTLKLLEHVLFLYNVATVVTLQE